MNHWLFHDKRGTEADSGHQQDDVGRFWAWAFCHHLKQMSCHEVRLVFCAPECSGTSKRWVVTHLKMKGRHISKAHSQPVEWTSWHGSQVRDAIWVVSSVGSPTSVIRLCPLISEICICSQISFRLNNPENQDSWWRKMTSICLGVGMELLFGCYPGLLGARSPTERTVSYISACWELLKQDMCCVWRFPRGGMELSASGGWHMLRMEWCTRTGFLFHQRDFFPDPPPRTFTMTLNPSNLLPQLYWGTIAKKWPAFKIENMMLSHIHIVK